MNSYSSLSFLHPNDFHAIATCYHGKEEEPSPYHLEGSVLAHTALVEMVASEHCKKVALLHDIGKSLAKVEVFSKKHQKNLFWFQGNEAISFFLSHKYGVSKNELAIIVLHGIGMGLDKISYSLKDFEIFDVNMLMEFKRYDRIGSITKLDWKIPDYDLSVKNAEYIQDKPDAVILVGLLGSGKTTLSKEVYKDYARISYDDKIEELARKNGISYSEQWSICQKTGVFKRIEKEMKENLKTLLQNKKNIVIDMTNLSKKSRKRWISQIPASHNIVIHHVQ